VIGTISCWRPIVLLLDDLHWATKPTTLMLKHLVRATESRALLVIGTYRDSDIGRDHPLTDLLADLRREPDVGRFNLRGLSDRESVALMESFAGHDLEGAILDLARAVYEEADGSPFFMRELVLHLTEVGELVKVGDRWTYAGELSSLGIPDSIREVIGRRLSRLPGAVEELLASAAVIGRQFDIAVLAALTGRPGPVVLEALVEARRAALVREVAGSPGRFTFAHALIRDTLYDELGQARRMEAHRTVAQAMESLADGRDETYQAELAYHWLAATPAVGVVPGDIAKAVGYAETAGRRAMTSLAYEEAVHHFESALRAVRLTEDMRRRSELLTSLGVAQRCAGDPAHRETLLEGGRVALAQGDGDQAARAALANQRGFYSRYYGVDGERVAALEAALDAVGPEPTAVRARLLASLASELHFADAERRVELGREAVAIARTAGDAPTLAQALGANWFATWGTEDDERAALADELGELARRLPDRSIQFEAAVAGFLTAQGEGEVERARTALETATNIAEELGQPVLRWRSAYLQAQFAMLSQRFEDVERLASDSRRLGELAQQPEAVAFGVAPLLIFRYWQGRHEDAVELGAACLELFPTSVSFRLASAWGQALLGRSEGARTAVKELWADDFSPIPRDSLWLLHMVFSARISCLLGDSAAARRLYSILLPHRSAVVATQTVWNGPVALVLGMVAAELGDHDDAEDHFRRAVEIQERIGRPPTLVHTRLEWARMLARRAGPGDDETARTLLEAARPHARDLEMTGIIPEIDALLRELRG
jgi:tetratricopeptide (TPR) repeat protein